MTEYEKAEQDVAAAKVAERIAEWKAMEAKATYYRYASEAMAASAEVMGSRIRRDNAIASEFVEKAQCNAADALMIEPSLNAALSRSPNFAAEQETAPAPVEIEIPEGFTKWEGGVCPVDPDATVEIMHPNGERHFGSPENVWWQWHNSSTSDGIIAYRVLQPLPTDEQDDASEFAEPMPDPEFVALDEQTCEPVDDVKPAATYGAQDDGPALNSDMQDEREQSVEGYAPVVAVDEAPLTEEIGGVLYEVPTGSNNAPVTNPEADALARAHDYYDPKAVADRERNAGLARLFAYNPFYKPKVDA